MPLQSELIYLNQNSSQELAALLIIRDGVNLLLDGGYQALYDEQNALQPDTKAFMRGRVVNKRARHNLCFSETGHPPDFANGKGTVIGFPQVPYTYALKTKIETLFSVANLQCEGNYYYDTSKNNVGVGFHGDLERKIVVGVRIGDPMPLQFRWFYKFRPISGGIRIMLNGGDIYAMSEKAVGHDWRRSTIPTLRHAAGSNEFLDLENKRIEGSHPIAIPPQTTSTIDDIIVENDDIIDENDDIIAEDDIIGENDDHIEG